MRLGFGLLSILAVFLVGCGDNLTDRFEETYAIADFEIEGTTRERTKSNEAWYTTAEGSYGITQNFAGDPGIDEEAVIQSALSVAEADGWEMEFSETISTWLGQQPSPAGEGCDNLQIGPGGKADIVRVRLSEGRC